MSSSKSHIIKKLESQIQEKLKNLKNLDEKSEESAKLKTEIWNLSKERFILKTRLKKNLNIYEGMIFTIGFTPEPIILNILANNPDGVFFIYTEASQDVLNRIIKETGLQASQYKREPIGKDNMLDAISLFKKGLNF